MNNTSPLGHCTRCGRQWMAAGWAHCAGCCQTFSSVSLHDRHRVAVLTSGAPCLKPDEIMSAGARTMFFDEETQIWRGPPKSEEELERLKAKR